MKEQEEIDWAVKSINDIVRSRFAREELRYLKNTGI